jgi:hypothetical protein
MPFSATPQQLKIFISHASEDKDLAVALHKCLSRSFGGRIEAKRMGTFEQGAAWRSEINQLLDRADILIAITSGLRKPGHSFTGYEIGAFHFSCLKREKMETYPHLDRIAIPFALGADVPATLSEFQGVGIDPSLVFAMKYDAADVANELNQKIFRLLSFLEDFINDANGDKPGRTEREAREEVLQEQSRGLIGSIKEIFAIREEKIEKPKPKLIVRVGRDFNGSVLSNASVWVEGDNSLGAFGIEPSASAGLVDTAIIAPMTWETFTANVQDADIAEGWRATLLKMLSAAIKGHFIDDRLTSFNREKTLRIFISQVIRFFNGSREFHMYVVDMMPPTEYGDPETTLFQNALKVALTYRSMFLEDLSPFGPIGMMATDPAQLPAKVSRMTSELEYLLQFSRDSRLDQDVNILAILGAEAATRVRGMFRLWNTERQRLLSAAQKIAAGNDVAELQDDFLQQLELFCSNTRPLNTEYLTAALRNLHSKIAQAAPRPAVVPKEPQLRDRSVDARRRAYS